MDPLGEESNGGLPWRGDHSVPMFGTECEGCNEVNS